MLGDRDRERDLDLARDLVFFPVAREILGLDLERDLDRDRDRDRDFLTILIWFVW